MPQSKVLTENNPITNGVIWKRMLVFFWPLFLASFFQQLYNTVDAVVVGRFVGKEALAAVGGSSAMIVMLLIGLFVGISSGATVVVAQFYGAEEEKDVQRAVHTGMVLAVIAGSILMVVGFLISNFALRLLDTPEELMEPSLLYLRIFYIGMIPGMIYNLGAGILRAVGDTRRPLYMVILTSVVNIVLDLLFVLVFHMGVAGVAIATVISQFVAAGAMCWVLMRIDDMHRLDPKKLKIHKDILRRILRIGLPSSCESIFYMVSNLMIQAAINGFGTDAISAWAAYGKVDGIFWMILQSMGVTITTFVGQNFGAGKDERVHKSMRQGTGILCAFTLILMALLLTGGKYLYYLFATDPNVIEIGWQMLRYLARFYIAFSFIEAFSGALRGLGDTIRPMIITFFGTCILRIIWLLTVVPKWHTIEMVEASYSITWIVTAAAMGLYYLWFMKKKYRQLDMWD